MSDIASRVKAIIVDKLGVDENEVVSEASFTNDLGADSLDTVELIMDHEILIVMDHHVISIALLHIVVLLDLVTYP